MTTTAPDHIPIESYGVLVQDNHLSEFDEVAEQVRRVGYAILHSGYSVEELKQLSEAFNLTRANYVKTYGEARLRSAREFHTIRALLTHGDPVFIRLATNQNLLNVLGKLIVGKFVLNQQNGIINPPVETYNQGAWHRDLPYQHYVSNTPLAVNALFCLDDFTIENGSTFVLPATHKMESFPSNAYILQNAFQVKARAGQFVVMDSMLFHCGGFNLTRKERRAVNHMYTIPYFRQPIDIPRSMDISNLNKIEREVLGLDFKMALSVEEYLMQREGN